MRHTRNTAARAEGDDQVDVQVAEEFTAAKEENVVQEEGTVSPNTSEEVAGKEAMSIEELQRMVQELYNIHIKASKFKNPSPAAQNRCTAHGAGFGEGVSRKESPTNSEFCDGSKEEASDVEEPLKMKGEFGVYPSHMAFKEYHKGLEDVKCKRVGDATFFAAKRAWERLVRDFPVTEATKKRLLPHAFDRDARIIFEEVANTNLHASVDDLWGLLEERLCNEVHQAALQDRFFDMKWNERRESFVSFAHRLRFAALALPGGMKEDVLLNRLKAGLPPRLRDQANLISGSFDVVSSRLSRLSTAAQVRGEQVREAVEDAIANTPRPSPSGSGQFAHVTCYFCGKKGHIARYCEEKRAARQKMGPAPLVAEQGRGSCPLAAATAPKENTGSEGLRF